MPITNPRVREREFLSAMYGDDYYPNAIVDKGRSILVRLCERIEAEPPADLAALYALTATATEEFNALQEDFWAAGSDLETVARDAIAVDVEFIATAYGFTDADIEELVAARDW